MMCLVVAGQLALEGTTLCLDFTGAPGVGATDIDCAPSSACRPGSGRWSTTVTALSAFAGLEDLGRGWMEGTSNTVAPS